MPQQYSTTTANIGLSVPSTGNPDYEPGNSIGMLTAAINKLDALVLNLEIKSTDAAGAAVINSTIGKVLITKGSVGNFTLAAPVVGQPSAGGQDGQELTIVAGTAFAHTITTPTNAINGSKHIATWTAAVGNSLKLVAYNGVWYTDDAPNGVTLS